MALRSSHSRPSALRGAPLFAVASLVVMACAPRAASPPALAPTPAASAGAGARDRTPLPRDIVERSALPLHALEGGRRLSEPELWDRLSSYRLVCLGEQHDSPQHHFAQRRA